MAVHKATILPRGNTLGMVQMLPRRTPAPPRCVSCARASTSCMGGRVAEELVFGAELR
jgi:ATP-dependent Zn protease